MIWLEWTTKRDQVYSYKVSEYFKTTLIHSSKYGGNLAVLIFLINEEENTFKIQRPMYLKYMYHAII